MAAKITGPTNSSPTVSSITEKLNQRGVVGPHNIFQRKTQTKADRETLDGRWRNESSAGFQQFSAGIQIPVDETGGSAKLAEIMWVMLNPAIFGRNIYFAHIDQSHYYDRNCEELLRDAARASGGKVPPICKNCLMFHNNECTYTLCHETFQLFKSDAEHFEQHKGKCNEDQKIQATKDGRRKQWHMTWALMHGKLLTQTCCKESIAETITLPQNDIDFKQGLRKVIDQHKTIVKSQNIYAANTTEINLLQYRH
jgi:hypothetical protein